MAEIAALLLAAGAGRRFGGPKALASDEHGSWLTRVATTLAAADLDVLAVLPTAHPETLDLLPAGSRGLLVDTVDEGIGASLRAGLEALTATPARAALVTLVDLPTLPASVLPRMLAYPPLGDAALRRAVFGGRPGHPVVIGRDHWAELIGTSAGDTGAGRYLREHRAQEIECGDLWDGQDIDHP